MRMPAGPARQRTRPIVGRYEWLWVAWWWVKFKGIGLPHWIDGRGRPWVGWIGLTDEERQNVKMPDVASGAVGVVSQDIPSSTCLAKFPRLSSLLNASGWDGGVEKGERSLMLFVKGSIIRALVKVECPPVKLSAVGRSFDEALAALDGLLGAADVPWEQDGQLGVAKPKKKK